MSVYIKGMEMPANCFACPMCYDMMQCTVGEPIIDFCSKSEQDFDFCSERHPRCPLIEVPPHGRLIDAFDTVKMFCDKGLYKYAEVVSDMPTIIPADKEGEK